MRPVTGLAITLSSLQMIALLPSAHAVPCKRICKPAIQRCVDAGHPRRRCKRQLVLRCRAFGRSFCDEAFLAPTTTTTTITTTTTTLVPLSADQKFVRQLFRVELGRDGGSAEWAPFVTQLGSGTTRSAVATEIQTSVDALTALVNGFYETYLGRIGGAAETAMFVSALQSSATDEGVLTAIATSNEYYAYAPSVPGVGGGSPSNATFVGALYEQLLGRAPSPAEVSVLSGVVVRSGRGAAVTAILASTEWRKRVVSAYFLSLLGRPGSSAEVSAIVATWTGWRATRLLFEAGNEFYAHASSAPWCWW